jgi:hypothetical protein
MNASQDTLFADNVAMHDRDVLLFVPIVPERHDLEPAEAARQLGDGDDLHAHVPVSDPGAIVIGLGFEDSIDLGSGQRQDILPSDGGLRDPFDEAPRPGDSWESRQPTGWRIGR